MTNQISTKFNQQFRHLTKKKTSSDSTTKADIAFSVSTPTLYACYLRQTHTLRLNVCDVWLLCTAITRFTLFDLFILLTGNTTACDHKYTWWLVSVPTITTRTIYGHTTQIVFGAVHPARPATLPYLLYTWNGNRHPHIYVCVCVSLFLV